MPAAKGKTFAIIGLGTFGSRLCEELSSKGGVVLAIDNQSNMIERVKEITAQSILVDSTDEEAMSQVPFEDVDTAVVAIGDNIEASILSTAILKKIGVPRIIARSLSDIHQRVLRQVGADEIINLEIDAGVNLAQKLISPDILDSIPISDSISLAEVLTPQEFVGKSLIELDLRKKMNITVAAIRRMNLSIDEEGNTIRGENILFPGPNDLLEKTDVMLVIGENEPLSAFKELQ
ncbi:MAG: potassium transporter TrkA [Spirochaetales bacterium]|nr:MAG: potassium transporter TrkA [Spirochaetales bacterium]